MGDGKGVQRANDARLVCFERRRCSTVTTRIVFRVRANASPPPERSSESGEFHERAISDTDFHLSWPRPEHHLERVSEMTQHLVRLQGSPASRCVRLQGSEPRYQRSPDG